MDGFVTGAGSVLFRENVLDGTKYLNFQVWYQENVLGGTKAHHTNSPLATLPPPTINPATPSTTNPITMVDIY